MTRVVNQGSVDPGAEDLLRATSLLVHLGGDPCDVHAARLDGDPWSKARPRFGRGGRPLVYVRPADRAAENRTRASLAEIFAEPMTGNVAMVAIFYRSNRQRIDADNMLKHVCDAATGVVWLDDSQTTAVTGIIELDADHPRTVLAFAPHESTLGRGTDWTRECANCGKPFIVKPSHTAAKYCGVACSGFVRGHALSEPIPCSQCGEPFRRATSAQRLCSPECRRASLTAKRKAKAGDRPMSRCWQCDKQLDHRRGGRCRECWRADPQGRPPDDLDALLSRHGVGGAA